MENDLRSLGDGGANRLTISAVGQVKYWQCLWDVLAIEGARRGWAWSLSRAIAGRWMRRYRGVELVSDEQGKRWVRVGLPER